MNKKWFLLPMLLIFPVFLFSKTDVSQAASSLEEQLQKLRKAGIPTTIEELNLPDIPDEENGALVYQKVFDLMEKNKEDIDILKSMFYTSYQEGGHSFSHYSDIREWSKWSDEQKELFPSLIKKNREMFALLEKAASMPKCKFPVAYEEGPAMLLPHLSKLHNCAYLLAIKATIEAEIDRVKALDTLLIGLGIGKSLSNEPLLLSQSIRISIEKTILVSIQNLLNEKPASQSQYEKLIKEFEEERKANLTSHALQGEYLQMKWHFDYFKKHPEGAKRMWKHHLSEELFQKYISTIEIDETYVARTFLKLITLTKRPYWEVKQKFEEIFKDIYALPIDKHFLSLVMFPVFDRAYQMEAYGDALLGAAEIGIADRIYRQKHGEFVDSLNQLTPDILPTLPLDPFTGKDYIYKKKDKGFIVYSVADNLKDDGGIPQFSEEGKKSGNFDIVWEDKGVEIQNASEKSQSLKSVDTKQQTIGWIPEGFPPFDSEMCILGKIEGNDLFVYACRKLSDKNYAGFLNRYRGNETTMFSGSIKPREGKYSEQELRDGIIFVYNVETGKTLKLIGTPYMVFDRKTRKWTVSAKNDRVALIMDNEKESSNLVKASTLREEDILSYINPILMALAQKNNTVILKTKVASTGGKDNLSIEQIEVEGDVRSLQDLDSFQKALKTENDLLLAIIGNLKTEVTNVESSKFGRQFTLRIFSRDKRND